MTNANEKIIEFEMALMHLQKAVDDLSDIVIKQEKRLAYLERQNVLLQSAIETEVVKPLSEETPPPHY